MWWRQVNNIISLAVLSQFLIAAHFSARQPLTLDDDDDENATAAGQAAKSWFRARQKPSSADHCVASRSTPPPLPLNKRRAQFASSSRVQRQPQSLEGRGAWWEGAATKQNARSIGEGWRTWWWGKMTGRADRLFVHHRGNVWYGCHAVDGPSPPYPRLQQQQQQQRSNLASAAAALSVEPCSRIGVHISLSPFRSECVQSNLA